MVIFVIIEGRSPEKIALRLQHLTNDTIWKTRLKPMRQDLSPPTSPTREKQILNDLCCHPLSIEFHLLHLLYAAQDRDVVFLAVNTLSAFRRGILESGHINNKLVRGGKAPGPRLLQPGIIVTN